MGRFLSHRHWVVALVAAVGIALSGAVFVVVSQADRSLAVARFEQAAGDRFHAVQRGAEEVLRMAVSIGALFETAERVSRSEFARVVAGPVSGPHGLQALAWVPRVPAAMRDLYERTGRAEGLAGFRFTEPADDGMAAAAERAEYFPVFYVYPRFGNEAALGFDLAAEPVRRAALNWARDTGTAAASAPLVLAPETGQPAAMAVLVAVPVYVKGHTPAGAAERRDALTGFVVAVVRVGDLIKAALGRSAAGKPGRTGGIDLLVFDRDPASGERLLHARRGGGPPGARPPATVAEAARGVHASRDVEFAGREWTLVATPSRPLPGPWRQGTVLASGLTITFLLTAYLTAWANRDETIRRLVTRRTGELRAALEALQASDHNLVQLHEMTSRPDTDFDRTVDRLLAFGLQTFGLSLGIVSRVEGNRYTVLHALGSGVEVPPPGTVFELGSTYCCHTLEADGAIGFHHTGESAIKDHPCYRTFGLEAYIGAPLDVAGQRFGTVNFSAAAPRREPYRDHDLVFMRLIAHWIGAALTHQRDRDALAASDERARSILETAVDGIVTIDDAGRIDLFNRAAEQIFGYAADEVRGRNVNILMPPPYREAHDGYLARYRDTGAKRILGRVREVEGRRKDGTVFPLSLAVSEMRLHGRQAFTGIVRDITALKEVDRLKAEFISTVSHELRTPLTSIIGALGLIRGGTAGPIEGTVRTMFDIAFANAERLVSLIDDILDIEKIAAGRMTFRRDVLDLNGVIRESLDANRGYGMRLRVDLALLATAPASRVIGDRDRLLQVMANLLSNAIKFSPAGGTVMVTVARAGPAVRVSVADRGPGIPAAFRDKIFGRFSQADGSDARRKGGTGLGLNIARAIVEKHGGTIGFETREGEGTTFFFDLPEYRRPDAVADAGPARPRILVCEDDSGVGRALAALLESDGLAADVATNADDVRRCLSRRSYQAMTLDIGLPGQDGLSLLREIRESARWRSLPVIVVSARAREDPADLTAEALHVVDWLQKPVDAGRLMATIHAAMRGESGEVPRILHVEDDPDVTRVVAALIGDLATVDTAASLVQARARLSEHRYDLVVLDLGLPDGGGEELLPELRGDAGSPVPVIVFSARETDGDLAAILTAALVKSRTSNEALLEAIRAAVSKDRTEAPCEPPPPGPPPGSLPGPPTPASP